MFRRSLPIRKYALVVLALLVLATAAEAQEKKIRVRNIKGKIKEVSEGRMVIIEAKENTEIGLQIRPNIEIAVLGTTDTAYLTPGVAVHFLAEMTKAGVVPTPLPEITVCDITEKDKALCILADPTKASNKGKDAVNMMEVRGAIKANKNGKMTIEVVSQINVKNNQQVKITLAPDAKVLVHFSDLAAVQPGDEVEVPQAIEIDPVLLQPSRKLTVKMANPLVAEKKGPPGRKTTAKSSK